MTDVLFGCGAAIGGPGPVVGPSRPFTHMHEALAKAFGERYRVFSRLDSPLMDPPNFGDAVGPVFDEVAEGHWAGQQQDGSEVFIGSGGSSRRQIEWLRLKQIGRAGTWPAHRWHGTCWFSSHWAYAQRVLAEEYAKFALKSTPIHPFLCARAEREQEISDFLVVPSRACADTYPTHLQSKIRIAEFGVDASHFLPPDLKEPSEKLRVIVPATNPIRKGLHAILDAAARLPPEKYVLTLTGTNIDIPPRWPHVRIAGWVDEPRMLQLYQSHDVYLSASREEGQALSSLEAAACGLPIVATRATGLPFEDGKEGTLIPANSGPALAEALRNYRQDRSRIEAHGKAARRFAVARPWDKFGDRIVEIVKEGMEG